MRLYSVRNQYGISYHLKIWKWSFRLYKITNGLDVSDRLISKYINGSFPFSNRGNIEDFLRATGNKYEVHETLGELTIIMPFAKDVGRIIKSTLPFGVELTLIDVSWSYQFILKNKWFSFTEDKKKAVFGVRQNARR